MVIASNPSPVADEIAQRRKRAKGTKAVAHLGGLRSRSNAMALAMWTRTANLGDLAYCLKAEITIGVAVDRTKHLQSALADGGCFVGGRFQDPEGILISAETFFSRPFVSLLLVEAPARRCGLASALMTVAEATYSGRQMFTSTNQSNLPMQSLLQGRGYLPAGVVLYLDPGDPELIFMKKAVATLGSRDVRLLIRAKAGPAIHPVPGGKC